MQSNRLTVDSQVGVDGQRCDFSDLVGSSAVVELVFQIAPRDIHSRRGVWVVNQKVKKNAEVVYRKLSKEDQAEFDRAMKKEIDSYVSSEAVRICESHGIPPERVMQMRWVHTWKVDTNSAVSTYHQGIPGSAIGRFASGGSNFVHHGPQSLSLCS